MSLTSGSRLGRYEIRAPLGAGVQGEVYRARDTKLGRDVAVKVLPEAVSQDPEKLARFGREAHLLASVNHPNVATLYGLEESNGQQFLVMELVEGETLADRLVRGPLPLDEALPLFQHIAEGLETAHEKGIIHRDLKPSNVKITPEGVPKILDFGLAKALVEEGVGQNLSQSPTLTRDPTETGVLLGTAPYMSPEQARGKPVDKRTDIWAFGCCLYEALSGKTAFLGETVSDTMAAVLKNEPVWEALPATTPTVIRGLLRRALQKDATRRLHDIADARIEIQETLADPTSAVLPPLPTMPARRIGERLAWLLAVLAASFAVWVMIRPRPQPPTRLAIGVPAGDEIAASGIALSPDGRDLVYTGIRNGIPQLYLRSMDQLEAVPLRGTEGATAPFFSPDGAWIGFFAEDKLKKASLAGGLPEIVCDSELGHYHGASWASDDVIVFTSALYPGLTQVSASGGAPEPLPHGEEEGMWHFWPTVLPDGKAVLFTVASNIYANHGSIAVQSLVTDQRRTLFEGSHPRYAPTGHIVFARGDSLWSVPFDSERLEVKGAPTPVLEGVRADLDGLSNFALAGDGSLVYVPSLAASPQPYMTRFVWVDREGREEPVAARPREYQEFTLSPDGTKVSVRVTASSQGDQDQDIWIYDLARDSSTRLIFAPNPEHLDPRLAAGRCPLWTPDGQRVAFGGAEGIFWKAADGTGAMERVVESPGHLRPEAFSSDGAALIFQDVSSGRDLGMVSLRSERVPTVLLNTEFEERNAALSPDGRWLAYESDESGHIEVYVRPFPDVNAGRWQVSSNGGFWPLWAPDGRELFYVGPRDVDIAGDRHLPLTTVTGREYRPLVNRMTAVSIETDPTFALGAREPLFEMSSYVTNVVTRRVAIAPDGQRFLLLKDDDTAPAQSIVVVQSWLEELKRLVPTE